MVEFMRHPIEWGPVGEVKSLREQMNRFFENMPYENFFDFQPSVDVFEEDNEVVVQADIPGIDPKDVEIIVSEESLTIKGTSKQNQQTKKENYYRTERRFGTFNRTVSLPARVEHKKAQANSKHGLMEIRIPKLKEGDTNRTHLRLE